MARQPRRDLSPRYVGKPEDIADACLAVVASRYTTGQTLVLDGGLGLMI